MGEGGGAGAGGLQAKIRRVATGSVCKDRREREDNMVVKAKICQTIIHCPVCLLKIEISSCLHANSPGATRGREMSTVEPAATGGRGSAAGAPI